MINRIHPKEALAWIALVLSLFLFSATVAFSKEKEKDKTKEKDGKIVLKITKTKDGKTIKIDTTFDANDEAAMKELLRTLDMEGDIHIIHSKHKTDKNGNEREAIIMQYNYHDSIGKEMEELREELNREFPEGFHSLNGKNLHRDSDSPDEFEFNFDFPDVPMPPGCEGKHFKIKKFNGHHPGSFHLLDLEGDFEGLDSLDDDDHIIILGDDYSEAPVLEKTVTGKNGQKAYVFRKNNNLNGTKDPDVPEIYKLKIYPNPSEGIVVVEFNSDASADLQVQAYDPTGKEVYNEMIKDFGGEYSNEINLSGKGKGSFVIKITRNGKSLSRKIVVN